VSRLSIIIPCPGEPRDFEETLASVLANRPDDSEILVPLRVPYDDPYELGGEVGFLFFPEHRTAIELINATLPCAKGDIIHLVACGLEATEGWADRALASFDQPSVTSVAPLVAEDHGEVIGVARDWTGRRRLVHQAGSARTTTEPLGPTLAAAFYRRRVLAAAGGLPDDVAPPLADLDLALRLQSLGGRHAVATASRMHGPTASAGPSAWRRGRAEERIERRRQVLQEKPRSSLLRLVARLVAAGRQRGALGKLLYLAGRIQGSLERTVEAQTTQWHAAAVERLEASSLEPTAHPATATSETTLPRAA